MMEVQMNYPETAIGFFEFLPPFCYKCAGFHQRCLETLDNQAMLPATVSPAKHHRFLIVA